MTLATIGAGIKALVEAAGGRNVSEEETIGFDLARAVAERTDSGRTHFWIVRLGEFAPGGGVGYTELHHRVVVEGYLGVARDAPEDQQPSDKAARQLLRDVVAEIADPVNLGPGGSLGTEGIAPEPIVLVTVKVGSTLHRVHRMRLTFLIPEDV